MKIINKILDYDPLEWFGFSMGFAAILGLIEMGIHGCPPKITIICLVTIGFIQIWYIMIYALVLFTIYVLYLPVRFIKYLIKKLK